MIEVSDLFDALENYIGSESIFNTKANFVRRIPKSVADKAPNYTEEIRLIKLNGLGLWAYLRNNSPLGYSLNPGIIYSERSVSLDEYRREDCFVTLYPEDRCALPYYLRELEFSRVEIYPYKNGRFSYTFYDDSDEFSVFVDYRPLSERLTMNKIEIKDLPSEVKHKFDLHEADVVYRRHLKGQEYQYMFFNSEGSYLGGCDYTSKNRYFEPRVDIMVKIYEDNGWSLQESELLDHYAVVMEKDGLSIKFGVYGCRLILTAANKFSIIMDEPRYIDPSKPVGNI